eukprot:3434358-Rhodomonas_salina.2
MSANGNKLNARRHCKKPCLNDDLDEQVAHQSRRLLLDAAAHRLLGGQQHAVQHLIHVPGLDLLPGRLVLGQKLLVVRVHDVEALNRPGVRHELVAQPNIGQDEAAIGVATWRTPACRPRFWSAKAGTSLEQMTVTR